ncbi:hypothetical protein DMB92_01750 [Campylobacter sp. MIT 99-7217]|nr:hypothetical protein DMB92_01750 [Campylobacter sp. MIT 99-7217]
MIFSGKINHIKELNISQCKLKGVTINSNIQGDIKFQKCIFEDFNKHNSSKNIKFMANFVFDFCEVDNIVNLMNFNFENRVSFKMSYFKDNVYFNNSHFEYYVNFQECKFEKTANFYGVKFEKIPNFTQAIFKKNLNLINTNLNFTFDDLEEKTYQEYENFNNNKEEKEKKALEKFVNDFRDSFRTFKNTLIKDNNLLDASNFHKYELYCKELELRCNWDKKGKDVKNMKDVEKNTLRFRDFVDYLLLGFYRKLCDHHTDLLKVFNNLILLISLYALFFQGFVWLHDNKIKDTKETLTLSKFFDNFQPYIDIGAFIFIILGGILIVYKNVEFLNSLCLMTRKYLAKILKKEGSIKLVKSLGQNLWCLIKENFIKLVKILRQDLSYLIKDLILIFFISYIFYCSLGIIIGFLLNLNKEFGYSLLVNTLFISLYICLIYTKSLFFGRYIILIISYIGFFIILIKRPDMIHPLIGKIANESDKSLTDPSLITLNISYTILITLVLFSLQKTARKNSIVPS